MQPKSIIVHHTATRPDTTLVEIDRWHEEKGFPESSLGYFIGYHFVILTDGQIVQTRRENEIGAHSPPNDGKIGICLVGNFENIHPSVQQLGALMELIERLKKEYNINDIRGHRDCNATECPGENLYVWCLQYKISWLKRLIAWILGHRKTDV